jgi:Xaa-Pro aminopeptidase
MTQYGIDACIIPSSDAHLSEYPPAHWKAREWISGFTGSAGTVVVLSEKAGLWTDSRYFLQAEEQLADTGIELFKSGLSGTVSIEDFLVGELSKGNTVAVDATVYSAIAAQRLKDALDLKGIALNISLDLVGMIWKDRPEVPDNEIRIMPVDRSGLSTVDKIAKIKERLRSAGANALIICALDEIAWTFNVRGRDVPYNPVTLAFACITENETALFIDPMKTNREDLRIFMAADISIYHYSRIYIYLTALQKDTVLLVDGNRTTSALFNAIPKACRVIEGISPANELKAIKNEVEISGFHKAALSEGVALTRFYIWLEKVLKEEKYPTEKEIAVKLSSFRAADDSFIGDSFATICGYNEHGAIVHYSATYETASEVRNEGILLLDSGGQYRNGTTDITRTIALGTPTERMKEDFTRVLQGNIRLAMAKFPEGTRGSQLDILARKALWDAGINYLHGTGHGIGHCLNVHEGPQSIRMEENSFPIMAGMVMSNEPGIYRTGEYGMRTENMMLVVNDSETEFGRFLSFETLSLCFIDTSLILPNLLSAEEKDWLNLYHSKVYYMLSPLLLPEENEWLAKKTLSI